MTNVGSEPINVPCSLAPLDLQEGTTMLTLWVTSDGFIDQYAKDATTGALFKIEGTNISAELDGSNGDPRSFCAVGPNKSIRVHSRTGMVKAGIHKFTAHAELSKVTIVGAGQGSEIVGTADSEPITKTLTGTGGGER